MEFSDEGTVWTEFRSKCFGATFSESKETNKNVLARVLVREEGFPTLISDVVSPNEFDVCRFDFKMNLLYSNLSCSDISAGNVHLSHFGEG